MTLLPTNLDLQICPHMNLLSKPPRKSDLSISLGIFTSSTNMIEAEV